MDEKDKDKLERELRLNSLPDDGGDRQTAENNTGTIIQILNSTGNINVGETKPVEDMNKAETSAFEEGIWDGVERRDEEDVTAFNQGHKQHHRRIVDKKEDRNYYLGIGVPFLTIFLWIVLIVLNALIASGALNA